jgi:hypothetical protein
VAALAARLRDAGCLPQLILCRRVAFAAFSLVAPIARRLALRAPPRPHAARGTQRCYATLPCLRVRGADTRTQPRNSDTVRSRETVAQLVAAEPAFGAARTAFLGSLYVAAAMDGETAKHLRVRSACRFFRFSLARVATARATAHRLPSRAR